MQVAGDEKIEPAIAVVVAPGCAVAPVAQRHAGFLGHVGEGAVVVVAVEAVLAEVGDKDVGPAVVVKVANGHTEAPAVVGHAGLRGHVGKRSVVVVMEERGVRRRGLAGERVIGRAIDEVDVEPAVVVVVDKAHAGAVGLQDVLFGAGAHHVLPASQAGRLAHILKNNGAGVDKAACGDGAVLRVVDGSERAGHGVAAHARGGLLRLRARGLLFGRGRLLGSKTCCEEECEDQAEVSRTALVMEMTRGRVQRNSFANAGDHSKRG